MPSPLLANIYLDPPDHQMAASGHRMIRYAGDFAVLCKTREEAESALARIRGFMDGATLTLHPDKTRIASPTPGKSLNSSRIPLQAAQRAYPAVSPEQA
jgi:retron-type reverse transcriptase